MNIPAITIFRFLLLLVIVSLLRDCGQESAEIPWHGIKRSIRYQPDGEDFVIVNGKRRFNRALYGSNTAFRAEAGDLPEFALYLPGMGGNMKLGIGRGDSSIWLTGAREVMARYRPGSMIYEIKDSLLGQGMLELHVLAMYEQEGMILKLQARDLPGDVNLYWAFGGATGKKFSRDGDIGADPESSFDLKPEYCADNEFNISDNSFTLFFGSGRVRTEAERYENQYSQSKADLNASLLRNKKRLEGLVPPGGEIRVCDAGKQGSPALLFRSPRKNEGLLSGKMHLPVQEGLYFILRVPGHEAYPQKPELLSPSADSETPEYSGDTVHSGVLTYSSASALFDRTEQARRELAGRIRLHTPDPYINTIGAALGIAADAIWEPPSYLHGAVAWRMRLPGWRGAYAADWLGWHDRARMHFKAYSLAQYTSPERGPDVPDPKTNLARQEEKEGNSIFTSGYISRYPDRISRPHHYDMNLVFIDQLLWHLMWTGDLEYAREVWPVIERHLAWEKRCFDPDRDGLYNAYCCIWASDALQYSGGGVTHSSAYNYRGNLLAGRIAEKIGKDPGPYYREAEKINSAIRKKLWLPDLGWHAECKDLLGLQLVHPAAGLWTIYHAIDAGLTDPFQAYEDLRYVDTEIPHISIIADGMPAGNYYTLSTGNWMPYTWSINNVALAENLHTSLAYWQAGRTEEAFTLWKSQFLESMYLGASPGNFQQLSFYDAFRGELYRDFADPVGMAARTLVEGLFGIVPDALDRTLLIRPGLPEAWDSASLETPDIRFDFNRKKDSDYYTIVQDFPVEMDLQFSVKARRSGISKVLVNGRETKWKNIEGSVGDPVIVIPAGHADTISISIEWKGEVPEKPSIPGMVAEGDRLSAGFKNARVLEVFDPQGTAADIMVSGRSVSFKAIGHTGHRTVFVRVAQDDLEWWVPLCFEVKVPIEFIPSDPMNKNELNFRIRNNTPVLKEGILEVNGKRYSVFSLPAGEITSVITVPYQFLVPGSNRITFVTTGVIHSRNLVNWDIRINPGDEIETIDLSGYFNDRVGNIFLNKYLSPRAGVPTLQIPVQGIGDWCSYGRTAEIDDGGLRARAGKEDSILLEQGIPIRTPGNPDVENIIFTSRWDNYPDRVSLPLSGRASHAYLLMTGSVHHMESRICNGIIRISYMDGSAEELELVPPETWWPIEQDYYEDGYAFRIGSPRPPRICLRTGEVAPEYQVLKKNGTIDIEGGAASLYDLPLDPSRELKELSLETLANDVVMGLMSITLVRNQQ
jgi:hypothetical protein